MNKLRVGFLVDGNISSYANKEIIDYIVKSDLFEQPIIIKIKNNIQKKSNYYYLSIIKFIQKIAANLFLKLISFIEKIQAKKHFGKYFLNYSLENYHNLKQILLFSKQTISEYYLDFDSTEIDKIISEDIDILVRFNSGILKGNILNCTKFGIISFHRGDNRVNRGGPTGFWEVFNNEPESGFILQKLNEELDGGDILFRGSLTTKESWTLNKFNLIAKSNFVLKKLLESIAENNSLPPFEEDFLHYRKLYKINNPLIPIKYIFKNLIPLVIKYLIIKIFPKKKTYWSVAYSNFNGFKTSLFRYKEIKNPPKRFLADPFIYSKNKRSIIFVEDYSFDKAKGDISAIEIFNGFEKHLGIILTEDFHLSFPFVFDYEGILYMVPETSQIKEIRLYKCDEFPDKWSFYKTIMKNVSAADSMIISKNNKWYLFSNICSADINDHNSELHIFYSDNPLSNSWKPLECGNPIIFDPLRARNAGIIYKNNNIYRINQIHKKKLYGHSFGVNLIEELNEASYKELRICDVDPEFKDKIEKTHHFHSDEFYSVIDFCRFDMI